MALCCDIRIAQMRRLRHKDIKDIDWQYTVESKFKPD